MLNASRKNFFEITMKYIFRSTVGHSVLRVSLIAVLLSSVNCGCIPFSLESMSENTNSPQEEMNNPAAKEVVAPKFFGHTIRWRGETLSFISRWYTGTANNWKIIAKANPGVNPKQLSIGANILIPEEILTCHDPMPHDFMKKKSSKRDRMNRVRASQTKKHHNKHHNIIQIPVDNELFGPIE